MTMRIAAVGTMLATAMTVGIMLGDLWVAASWP